MSQTLPITTKRTHISQCKNNAEVHLLTIQQALRQQLDFMVELATERTSQNLFAEGMREGYEQAIRTVDSIIRQDTDYFDEHGAK